MLTSSASLASSGGSKPGQPLRQHRLARARRPDHQKIVAARRRHFERALSRLLALDVLEVELGEAGAAILGSGELQNLRALEVVDDRQKRGRRQHLDPAGPGGLAARGDRADEALALRRSAERRGQHARHRLQAAVERQLAQRHVTLDLLRRQNAHGGEQAQGYRQVEVAALFQEIGRRQIDGDALGRQREAHARRARRARARAIRPPPCRAAPPR